MAVAGLVMLLLLKQPDLGTAVILGLATVLLLFVAGARVSYLVVAMLAAAPVVYQAVVGTPWRLKRILAYIDPWSYRYDVGYQITESLISVGSGGVWGLGLGDGKQKLLFLPEAHTDYILAIVNQELVTASELQARIERVRADATRQRSTLPPEEQLRREVLDALIDERVQLTHARESGTRIDDAELDRAVNNVAVQNQVTMVQLRERLRKEGIEYARFRTNVRDQLLTERVREREVQARIRTCLPSAENENDWYVLGNSPAFINRPEVLHALGIVPDVGPASFTLADDSGKEFVLEITPVAMPPIVNGIVRLGGAPPVVDAADVLADPEGTLGALCAALGLAPDPAMLAWPAGPRPTDGVWAPYWYAAVERSTGFGPPAEAAPRVPDELLGLLERCRPYYEELAAYRIGPPARA